MGGAPDQAWDRGRAQKGGRLGAVLYSLGSAVQLSIKCSGCRKEEKKNLQIPIKDWKEIAMRSWNTIGDLRLGTDSQCQVVSWSKPGRSELEQELVVQGSEDRSHLKLRLVRCNHVHSTRLCSTARRGRCSRCRNGVQG